MMDLKLLQDTPPWEWPPNTDKALLKILKNTRAKAEDRLLAAELAGDYTVVNDEIAEELIAIAANSKESEELRAQAAIALGPALDAADTSDFGEYEDCPISEEVFTVLKAALAALYRDEKLPKLVRRRVLEAAVRAREPWQVEAVRKAFATGDAEWKLTAVFGMSHMSGFEAEIMEALESEDEDIHYEAVKAAGHEEVDAAWEHILPLAESAGTEKALRMAAIFAISQIRPAEARPLLYELAEDPDPDISEAADEAVLMSGTEHEFNEDQFEEEERKAKAAPPPKEWIN